jgi:quercetin dioxygenase-like cupin family protein
MTDEDRVIEPGHDGVLKVLRGAGDEPYKEGAPDNFIGAVRVYSVSELLGTEEIRIRLVRFTAGARTRPHRHSRDQLLSFIDGPGIVAVDGGEDQRIEPGEFVLLPGGTVHMHGAAADAPTSHISMMRSIDSDFESEIPPAWQRYRLE